MKNIHDINVKYKLYPRWIYKKDRSRFTCENDKECPFPTACCNHPFYPVKYCCNGWNKRELEYAYIYETVR